MAIVNRVLDAQPVLHLDTYAGAGGGTALEAALRRKQPDWSYDEESSGQSPADRLDQRATTLTT